MKSSLRRVFPIVMLSVAPLETNGMPDYRYSKSNEYYRKRYSDVYFFDNQMQLSD